MQKTSISRKALAALGVVSLALAGSLAISAPASAASDSVTKVITGFADSSTDLTTSIKKKIKKFVKANPGFTQVSCTGYADNPGAKTFNSKLGKNRAKGSCTYAMKFDEALLLGDTEGVKDKRRGADIRRVEITLSQATFNVYFDYMGGTGTVDTEVYELGTLEAVELPAAQKLGYVFTGWYTKQWGGTKVGTEGDKLTPTRNRILYAQWGPELPEVCAQPTFRNPAFSGAINYCGIG